MDTIEVPDSVIIPPPSIKSIILKTAQYVARNGAEFEDKIKQQSSSKFTFLDPQDAYHGYYTFLMSHRDELLLEDKPTEDEIQQAKWTKRIDSLEPLPTLDFLLPQPSPIISTKDHDLLKLVAQFVGVNGDDYKQAIKNKYPTQLLLFGFMDRGHSLNALFEGYVEQYRKVVKHEYEVIPTDQVLERAYKRAEYDVSQRQSKQVVKREEEERKLRFARVDWGDFIIVETIEFTEVDSITELEQPWTIEQLQLKSLDQKSKEVTQVVVVETENDKVIPPVPGMKIKEFGTTRIKQQQQSSEKLIQCPITGKMIPEQNFQRHLDILLRDPKYKEEKAKYEAKIKNTNLQPDEAAANLKALIKKPSGNNDDSNKRQKKVVWDGYQSSVDYVTHKNQAKEDEVEEYKRKQKEHAIGPATRPSK